MLNAASDLPEDPALLKALIAQLQAQNKKLDTRKNRLRKASVVLMSQ